MQTPRLTKIFMRIKYKLLIAFLLLGVLPFAILGSISFFYAGKVLTARAFDQLESIRDVKKAQMERFFAEHERDLNLLSKTVISLEQSAFDKLNTVQENKRAHLIEYLSNTFSDINVLSKNFAVIQAMADFSSVWGKNGVFDLELYDFFEQVKYGQSLSQFKSEYRYQDLMLITPKGDIVFTLNRGNDLGKNLMTGPLSQTHAAHCFRIARTGTNIQDFNPYPPADGRYFAFIGAPLIDKSSRFIGVVMLKINNTAINRIVQPRQGMGKTGETYVLGNVHRQPEYRSDRLIKDGAIGSIKNDPYLKQIKTNAHGPFLKIGSTGEMEIAKYDLFRYHDLDWMVATTMSLEEAISPEQQAENDYFNDFITLYDISDLYLIATNGDIFYSVSHQPDYDTNLLTGPYTDTALADLFLQVMESAEFQFVDFSTYPPVENQTAAFLGIPIARNGVPHMMIALRLSFERINTMMQKETGVGKTGDIYLVGPDLLMRSDSLLKSITHSAEISFKNPSTGRADTQAVRNALNGQKGVLVTTDFSGTPVLSAYTPINAWGKTWALVAEINQDEALSFLGTLKLISFIVAFFSISIIVVISLLISRHFAQPVSQLTKAARRVKERHFDISVDVSSNDELELMADAFNAMVMEIRTYSDDLNTKVDQLEATEIELKRANNLLNAVMEGTSDAIFVKDIQGSYLLANTATCETLGKPLQEILGKSDSQLFPESSVKIINDVDRKVLSSGKTFLTEERLHTAAHGDSYWLSNKSPYLNRAGEIVGIIGISRNITQIKQSQHEKEAMAAQLQQAHKMEAIGTLAGGIAHDFNNILAAIIGYTEIVQGELKKDSPENAYTWEILNAAQRAKLLVKQILTFSRKSDQVKTPIKMGNVLNEVLKLLRATLPTTIEIKTDIKNTDAMIMAEPTQVHQVIMNICTNASQAIEEDKGLIRIGLKNIRLSKHDVANEPDVHPGDYVRFRVQDNGVGISPDIIERIFDPYFTTKDVGKGSGMGLAVVHGIMKSHDGLITIDSQKGEGTQVDIYFPRITETALQSSGSDRPVSLPGTERVLVVDDETDILTVNSQRLQKLGYQVTTASSSLEAFDLFQSDPDGYDILVTDQTMPRMTGAELAEKIFKIRPGLPVILCTGFSAKLDKQAAKKIGIRIFLMKPLEGHTLSKAIREALDNSQANTT